MSQLDQTRIRPPHADEGDDTEGHIRPPAYDAENPVRRITSPILIYGDSAATTPAERLSRSTARANINASTSLSIQAADRSDNLTCFGNRLKCMSR